MALSERLIERVGGAAGAGVGIGAVLIGRPAARLLGRGVRSLTKGTIKGCLLLEHHTRNTLTGIGTGWQRLYDEAQTELRAEAPDRKKRVRASGSPSEPGKVVTEPRSADVEAATGNDSAVVASSQEIQS